MIRITQHFLFVLMLVLATESCAQNGDINLLRRIHLPVNVGLDNSMKVVSASVFPAVIAVPAGILIYNYAQTHSLTGRNQPYVIGAALVGSAAVTFGMKYAINRPRPFVTYNDIEQRDMHAGPYSFPSGHTSSAFALATSLSLCYQKWYVIAPAALWAITVGYSRMRLGVHFPTDVLAGAIIGAGCGYLSWYVTKKITAP